MKKTNLNISFFLTTLLLFSINVKAQLGISATAGFTPDTKAILDVSSTTKGMLIPRMNTAQRTGITLPIENGMMVYDTDLSEIYVYNLGWKRASVLNAPFTLHTSNTPSNLSAINGYGHSANGAGVKGETDLFVLVDGIGVVGVSTNTGPTGETMEFLGII